MELGSVVMSNFLPGVLGLWRFTQVTAVSLLVLGGCETIVMKPPVSEPVEASAPKAEADGNEAPGFLTIVCTPFCDDVSDGGRSLGPSPIVHIASKPGQHRISFKRSGFPSRVISVAIVSGEVTAQRVAMNCGCAAGDLMCAMKCSASSGQHDNAGLGGGSEATKPGTAEPVTRVVSRPTPTELADVTAELQSAVGTRHYGIPNTSKYPTIDARLRKLLGSSYAAIDRHNVGVTVPVRKEGDFVIAEACLPHQCGAGIIVVFDVVTGSIHCGMDVDDAVHIFSEDPTRIPAPLVEWKKDHVTRAAPPMPPPSGGAEFNKGAAAAALGAAAGGAKACKKPDGPTGSGRVKVTFAPSGNVTTANVDGPPFAGTSTGGCIAGEFRGVHVPPFDGSPVTVTKSFNIE